MEEKIKLELSCNENIPYYNTDINPLMKDFVYKIWNEYYPLFCDLEKRGYFVCYSPFRFFYNLNKYFFIINKGTNDRYEFLSTSKKDILKITKKYINKKKNNNSLKRYKYTKKNIKNIKINKKIIKDTIPHFYKKFDTINKFKFKNRTFIKYINIFKKYNLLKNNNNILVLIENDFYFGHMEALEYYINNKNLNFDIDLFYFYKFRYLGLHKSLMKKHDYIQEQIKYYSKILNNIYKYEEDINLNLNLIGIIKNKYNLIIADLSNWLSISNEYLEYSDFFINLLTIIITLHKLNINGSLILTMSINLKCSCDLILIIKEYFKKVHFNYDFNINFMPKKIYRIEVIFEGFLGFNINKKNNVLNKLENIFKTLIKNDFLINNFNIKNKKIRKKFNITKILFNNIFKINLKYPVSLLNLSTKSKKYNIFKEFNTDFFIKKNNQLINLISLFNKGYNLKIPLEYHKYQLKESIKLLKKLDLEYVNTKDYLKNKDFPYLNFYFNINSSVKNLYNFIPYFINKNNKIKLKSYIDNKNLYEIINLCNISSNYNEKIYLDYWDNHRLKIKNFCKKKFKIYSEQNLSNSLYFLFNKENLLRFEILIVSLIYRFKPKSVLDVFYTTDKRLIGCLVKEINYTLINKNKDIEVSLNKYYINHLNLTNKKYKFKEKLNEVKNKHNLIFVDTESTEYEKPNITKYMNLLTERKGVLIYSYYEEIKDKINNKYEYEIIYFNKQILLIYFKSKKFGLDGFDYPFLNNILSDYEINERINNLKLHKKQIIYQKDSIIITFKKNEHWFNRYDITSYFNELKYINFWKENREKIIKYVKPKEDVYELKDLRNEMYYQYNNKNLLYFEETILNLIELYNSKSVLDLHQTTYKRLLACCVKNIKYDTIRNIKYININSLLKEKYGTANQRTKENLKTVMKRKYDLIFIDTESSKFKLENNDSFREKIKMLNKNGVLIYMYYSKKPIFYNENYEKVLFNKQIFIVYKEEKVINKKTYLILSKYLTSSLFKKFLPDNWVEVNKYNQKIDFVYVDAYYRTYKELNNINKNYNSVVKYIKHDFDDKDYLHKYVEQDNPKIFNKYFMEQYEINIKNINKYKDLFKDKKSWIVKPQPGGAGFGVKVFNSFKRMKEYILNFKEKWKNTHKIEKWVIQKYIDNLLLVDGKKFHIRLNVLNGINEGKSFSIILDRGQLLTAAKKYDKTKIKNKNISNSHLGSTKKIYYYPEYFKKNHKTKYKNIEKQIKELHNYLKDIIKFKCKVKSKNCSQIIGIDLIITDNYKVKCIELNMTAGFAINKKKDKELIIKSILENFNII